MASLEQIQSTGIFPNEETQCYEAWVVKQITGEKMLVASCSMCVPQDQYCWWVQQVWGRWMPEWGIFRSETSEAA